ncbi:MAG TPA: helix-turn-helix domain-containing protein, partial [Pirellulales bacterium]
EIALATREQRQRVNLSQKELARRLKTSQPRIVKIERAAADVSLDQILRAYSAAGGRIAVKQVGKAAKTKSHTRTIARPAASRAAIELKLS